MRLAAALTDKAPLEGPFPGFSDDIISLKRLQVELAAPRNLSAECLEETEKSLNHVKGSKVLIKVFSKELWVQ